jgi:hypothetical protein
VAKDGHRHRSLQNLSRAEVCALFVGWLKWDLPGSVTVDINYELHCLSLNVTHKQKGIEYS